MRWAEPRFGLRPLEWWSAIVLAGLLGIGWAVITGAESTILGRLGFAVIGVGIGLVTGLRFAGEYLDGGHAFRRFMHALVYLLSVMSVLWILFSRDDSRDVPGMVGSAAFVAVPWLMIRNFVTTRGDRDLARRLVPMSVVAVAVLAIVAVGTGLVLPLAIVVLMGLSLSSIIQDQQTRRNRVRIGDLDPLPIRRDWRRWRLWWRVVVVAVSVVLGPILLLAGGGDQDGVNCGWALSSLQHDPETDCYRDAVNQFMGGMVVILIGGMTMASILHGRGPDADGRADPE